MSAWSGLKVSLKAGVYLKGIQQTAFEDLCFLWQNAQPTFFIEKGCMLFCYVIKVCFHFAHLIYPKMNHGGPLFFSLICKTYCNCHGWAQTRTYIEVRSSQAQSRKFARLYTCCSPTQVFNKMIWFIPLEVNNLSWLCYLNILWWRCHYKIVILHDDPDLLCVQHIK